MTTSSNDPIAQWLDAGLVALDGHILYPGDIRKLRWPDFEVEPVGETIVQMAKERGWTWVSYSLLGISFMYKAEEVD